MGQGLIIIEALLSVSVRQTTLGRIPLDEWSVRRRDPYLTPTLTRDRHPCFRWDSKPADPARKRLNNHILDGVATGMDSVLKNIKMHVFPPHSVFLCVLTIYCDHFSEQHKRTAIDYPLCSNNWKFIHTSDKCWALNFLCLTTDHLFYAKN